MPSMAVKLIKAWLDQLAWLTLFDQGFSAGVNRAGTIAEGLKPRV